ncbi:MAG: hypothetical protein JEZ02_00835 [Desulfatibacillum sp.]|nr:hypothetical protein [Desulfatibacillum sp.]
MRAAAPWPFRFIVIVALVPAMLCLCPITALALDWSIDPASSIGGWRAGIVSSGDYAYYGEAYTLRVADISGDTPVEVASLSLEGQANAILISGSYLYIVISPAQWFGIVDISNPLSPFVAGFCQISDWYISKGGVSLDGPRVYLASYNSNSNTFQMQVVDVSNSASPSVISTTNDIQSRRICASGGIVYAGCKDTNFRIYDVSDLSDISQLGVYANGAEGQTLSKNGDYVYICCGAESQQGVQIMNVSNTSSPYKENEYTYAGMQARSVAFHGGLCYIAGYNGGVVVVDLSDPLSPDFKGQYYDNFRVDDLALEYPYVYTLSYNDRALTRVAVADPANMSASGSKLSPSYANVLFAQDNTLFMGAFAGLWAYDITDPNTPDLIGYWPEFAGINKMAVENGRLYGLINNDIQVLDVSDVASGVSSLGTYDPGTYPSKMAVFNGIVYLLEGDGDLLAVNATNPPSFSIVQDTTLDASVSDLWAGENLVLVGGSPGGIGQAAVYSIGETGALTRYRTILTDYAKVRCTAVNGLICVSSHTGGTVSASGAMGIYSLTENGYTQLAKTISAAMEFNDLAAVQFSDGETVILASGFEYTARRSTSGSINGVHTYSYLPEAGTLTKSHTCPSEWPTGITSAPTSTPDTYVVVTCDSSEGNYLQIIGGGDGLCCLETEVSPVEAGEDGCTASPPYWGRGECNSDVSVSAEEVSPWNFKDWTGAAAGTNKDTDAIAGGNCSVATAHFVKPVLTLSPGGANPGYVEVYGQNPVDEKEKVAEVIILSVNEVDDWLVNAVSFTAQGAGNDKDDITIVKLHLGGIGGAVLSSGTYTADNGSITLAVNQTIPAGNSITLTLTYEFVEDKACPCNDYAAIITAAQVAAEPVTYPNYAKLPPPPEFVQGGPLKIKPGLLQKIDGDLQYGEKELPLPKAFKLQLTREHPDCVDKVRWELGPEAASFGAKFSNDGTTIDTQVDGSGNTEILLTLGEKVGTKNPYYTQATLYSKGADCATSNPIQTFTSYGAGVEVTLKPQHDGSGGDDSKVASFISDIEASNKLTVELDMAPTDFAEVKEVQYKIGDSAKTGTLVTQNKEYFATYDMKNFNKNETISIKIIMEKDGAQFEVEETYLLGAYPLPKWFGFLSNISEQINKEFKADDQVYNITFQYPTNFIWRDLVPSNIGLLGGLGNDFGVEFTGEANYFITENSNFGAKCSSAPKLLGQEFSLEGSLRGEFDKEFLFQRGTGTIKASTEFDLPSKGYSKTFVVYAIPLTVAVDISGNVEIYVNGTAILNKKLEIERANVTPGTTVTGHLTLSLSAVLGLAKISATGSPSVTLEIQIDYRNAGGTTTTWTGEVVVPIKICGSLFWGLASAELYSTELGPWNFGTGRKGPLSKTHLTVDDIYVPRLMTTSGLSANASGQQMVVWIDDTEPGEAKPNPDVFFRYFDGSNWTSSAALIGANSPNTEWETDPRVVFMGGQTALAAWTANSGDPTLDNLNDILAAQDIDYSVWDGSNWSAPGRVIDDDNADGSVTLAYDPLNSKVLAAWVRDSDATNSVTTRTDWIIQSSIYDIAGDSWSESSPITGTTGGTADFGPALATNATGQGLLVWCRDGDGRYYSELDQVINGSNVDATNADSDVFWALYSGNHFSAGTALTTPDNDTETACDVACGPSNLAVAVWVTHTDAGKILKYSVFDFSTSQWGTPGVIAENSNYIEDPRVVVDSDGVATALWRSADDVEGDLYSSQAADLSDPQWSDPEKITDDQYMETSPSIALDSQGNLLTAFNAYDMGAGEPVSGQGFSGSMNVAPANPGTVAIIGNWSDTGIDQDSDQIYEALAVFFDLEILEDGDYEVRVDLYSDAGKITQAVTQLVAATTTTHTVQLIFDGAILHDRQVNGPYYIKNLRILDNNASSIVAATAEAPYTTGAYEYTEFISGPIALDKESYQGLDDTMTVTLTRAALNTNSGIAESAQVQITSTMDPSGCVVNLIETGVDTGIFTGNVSFSTDQTNPTTPAIHVLDHTMVQAIWFEFGSSYPWIDRGVWTSEILQGDLNMDGTLTIADAIAVIQALSGLEQEFNILGYTSAEPWLGEEEALSTIDALYILQTVSQTP